jgi:hypothetical protein
VLLGGAGRPALLQIEQLLRKGDYAALIRAIKEKLFSLGDAVSFCGHGPGSTIGSERRTNSFVRG